MKLNENRMCYWCSRTEQQLQVAGVELQPQYVDCGEQRQQHGFACSECLPLSTARPAQNWTYTVRRVMDVVEALVHVGDESYPLPHIVRHSPTGFGFGYCGSGPADLARSMLIHYFRCFKQSPEVAQKLAEPLYQEFKRQFIAAGTAALVIQSDDIDVWLGQCS